MKKIWFLPMLASSTMLTGCASLLQDSATYDPEVSRAGNIGKIFEIEIDDQEVAQGIELGNDSSVMLDSLVWSGSLQTAGRVGGLPGTTSFGKSLGIGFGLALLEDSFKSTPGEKYNSIFGYVREEDVPVVDGIKARYLVARKIFVDRAVNSMKAIIQEAYPNARVVDKTFDYAFNRKVHTVTFSDDKLGCKNSNESDDDNEWCGVYINSYSAWVTPNLTSKVLGEPQFSAYSFTAEGNVNYVGFYGLDKQLPWVETMMKGAHHLPEYTFMYLTSNSKINGRTTPPMIIEKDRVNFFVKPKVNKGSK